jgi:hypothetical protein
MGSLLQVEQRTVRKEEDETTAAAMFAKGGKHAQEKRGRRDRHCNYCGKDGHSEDYCWDKKAKASVAVVAL